jgi:hypothetical protein
MPWFPQDPLASLTEESEVYQDNVHLGQISGQRRPPVCYVGLSTRSSLALLVQHPERVLLGAPRQSWNQGLGGLSLNQCKTQGTSNELTKIVGIATVTVRIHQRLALSRRLPFHKPIETPGHEEPMSRITHASSR